MLEFVRWLREHNERAGSYAEKVGFYGLDLYSLHASIEAVLAYLERTDPEAARDARKRYACFDHFGGDPQSYGSATRLGLSRGCEDEVVAELVALQRRRGALLSRDGAVAEEEFFLAEQNARVVRSSEEYYREMFTGHVATWKLRDRHMADTLDALLAHLDRRVGRAKVVVWAHNSHVGDARATELGRRGELNIGQLARERHRDAFLVGFSTYEGTVTAATDSGGPAERKRVRRALGGSCEELFHESGVPRFLLDLDGARGELRELAGPRLQRAIAVIHVDRTRARSRSSPATGARCAAT